MGDQPDEVGAVVGPLVRPRRLRSTPVLRRMVAETAVRPSQLVLPLFVREGLAEPHPIGSMPGVVQHSRSSLRKAAHEAATQGLGGVMLFGIPESKDAQGSGAIDPAGVLNLAIADVVAEVDVALGVLRARDVAAHALAHRWLGRGGAGLRRGARHDSRRLRRDAFHR